MVAESEHAGGPRRWGGASSQKRKTEGSSQMRQVGWEWELQYGRREKHSISKSAGPLRVDQLLETFLQKRHELIRQQSCVPHVCIYISHLELRSWGMIIFFNF